MVFPLNDSTFCLLQAVRPSYTVQHCHSLSYSHIGVSRTATEWHEKTRHRI
jgi:peroxiredoxin